MSKTSAGQPTATYRLQLRNGMTFARAAELAPYLAGLGISHLYLSPIFKATPGSTHGYDGIDFAEIDPELGGEEGFRALASTMRAAGIGIILDIVPNHMGAHPNNPWWRSVLEWGAASPYANHFDVDWSAPKLVVPRLGDHYGAVLRSGALKLTLDAEAGEMALAYGDMRLPLHPPSYALALNVADQGTFGALALKFAASSPASAGELKSEVAAALLSPEAAAAVDRSLADINAHWGELHKIHEQQIWRLAHWRTARENLTYRRFFEISELVGVRVELPNVFDDVHNKVLGLIRDGHIDGLRIDHIDGLADPRGYLDRLKAEVGRGDFYIIVEKILGTGEELPASWPIAGTTGYEFINSISGLLVDDLGQETLTRSYEAFIGQQRDIAAEVVATKRRTITRNLAGELDYLTDLAARIASEDIETRDLGRDTLRRAIVELASAMPVYRTYADANGLGSGDEAVIDRAIDAARRTREVEDVAAFAFLARLFKLDFADAARRAEALQFTARFQQTTGPITAKAFEDTLFYRYNRLIAVNEVGGDLDPLGRSAEDFHRAMVARLQWPLALTATATHDTKRGEDARARIYAISEAPDVWHAAVARWADMNAPLKSDGPFGPIPEPDTEWMFYQSLLGSAPPDIGSLDPATLAELSDRMTAFVIKAARESKLHTTWTQPDEDYERGLKSFVEMALDPATSSEFLHDFAATAHPFMRVGAVNSLTQTALKLFAPGVPDVYQGTETWDLALVDPDNRRPVDFAERAAVSKAEHEPDALLSSWQTGAIKQHVIHAGLRLRGALGFERLDYNPLNVTGPRARHVLAFARRSEGGDVVVIVATRHAFGLLDANAALIHPACWGETRIAVPVPFPAVLTDVLGRRTVTISDRVIDVAEVLRELPVAILTNR
jgi:(1->4)-alpha-D-glucan 1-alpha-D-glucosylmutase